MLREACCLYLPIDWKLDGVFRVDCAFAFSDHRQRDLDNLAKCALDAMLRLAFRDDSQVHDLRLVKTHGDTHPRTVVTVTRISDTRKLR
jgi:Holliday junction resolvase RusA-like endonuclease